MKHAENILVLILGGTINGDWTKTEHIVRHGQNMTRVHPYRDKKGRLPVQIYLEDIKQRNITIKEISDKDSKDLTPQEREHAIQEIIASKRNGYDRIIYITGTDALTQIGTEIQFSCLPYPPIPVIMVSAMQEMTRDMDLETGIFNKTRMTDGFKTLDEAIDKNLTPGIYAPTTRGYHAPWNVKKDFERQEFVPRIR